MPPRDLQAYKFGDRWQMPAIGRWLSEDPSGLRYGTNHNQALNNSPHNFVDPSGHFAVPVLIWAAKAALTYVGVQAGLAAVETTVEAGFTYRFGDYGKFSLAGSFAKNFGINLATGWIGGGQTRLAARVGMYAMRQGIEIGGDTAYDVYRGQSLSSALLTNTVGSIIGEGIGLGLKAAWRSNTGRISRAFVGGFSEGFMFGARPGPSMARIDLGLADNFAAAFRGGWRRARNIADMIRADLLLFPARELSRSQV